MFVEICLTLENLGQSLTYKLIYILVRVVLSSHRSVQYDIYSLSLSHPAFFSPGVMSVVWKHLQLWLNLFIICSLKKILKFYRLDRPVVILVYKHQAVFCVKNFDCITRVAIF